MTSITKINKQGGWVQFIPAAIGAAASLVGGAAANKANKEQASNQMAFQREMSNTAHQRQVKDLRLAGLNPILSAGGGGASSPGGAQAKIQDIATPAAQTALATYQAGANVENTQANTALQQADKDRIAADERLKIAQTDSVKRDIDIKDLPSNVSKNVVDQFRMAMEASGFKEGTIQMLVRKGTNMIGKSTFELWKYYKELTTKQSWD